MLSFLFLFTHERAHKVLPGSPPTGASVKELMRCESLLCSYLKSECGCSNGSKFFTLHSSLFT